MQPVRLRVHRNRRERPEQLAQEGHPQAEHPDFAPGEGADKERERVLQDAHDPELLDGEVRRVLAHFWREVDCRQDLQRAEAQEHKTLRFQKEYQDLVLVGVKKYRSIFYMVCFR